jgi:hypothetical protein
MKLTDITPEDTTVYVGLLTEEQKDSLVGVYYAPDSIYNPIQDADDNWVISVEEMQDTTNEETLWVKELPLIEYVPKPTPPMPQ